MKLGRLNHVGVATPSIERSIAFYRDVMGFEFQYSEPEMHWASFKVGGMTFNLGEGAEETHGTGDRNNSDVAWKDAEDQLERDRENRHNDKKRDRADETGTGNREPPSEGADVP